MSHSLKHFSIAFLLAQLPMLTVGMILRGFSHWTKRFSSRKLLCSLYGIPVKKTEGLSSSCTQTMALETDLCFKSGICQKKCKCSHAEKQLISLKITHTLFCLTGLRVGCNYLNFLFIKKETSPVGKDDSSGLELNQRDFSDTTLLIGSLALIFFFPISPLRNIKLSEYRGDLV